MKRGFTLVELLAVIIALGIVVGIAFPGITKIMEKSKLKAFEASVKGYIKALDMDNSDRGGLKNYYSIADGIVTEEKTNENIDVQTGTSENGSIEIDNKGKVNGSIYNNRYCAKIIDSRINIDEECSYTSYNDGDVIYFNPETSSFCTEGEAVSTAGTKTGCMKWYAYNDNKNEYRLKLILDHNTTPSCQWNDTGKIVDGSTILNSKLKNDTQTWDKELNPRIISAYEIKKLVSNQSFDGTRYTNIPITSEYNFLLYNGGNYWTTSVVTNFDYCAWGVGTTDVYYRAVADAANFGVRPVISINKNNL
ncbi:MAG: type II secretion system GspH family protein [Tenericutes bacterium]|nr:type II secretion system GspH family protein [Mycoplasmatota bacterium]